MASKFRVGPSVFLPQKRRLTHLIKQNVLVFFDTLLDKYMRKNAKILRGLFPDVYVCECNNLYNSLIIKYLKNTQPFYSSLR